MTDKKVEDLDEVITVTMPRGDYLIMREIIKDRKSVSHMRGKMKTFSLALGGVVGAWWLLGEKFLMTIRHLIAGTPT